MKPVKASPIPLRVVELPRLFGIGASQVSIRLPFTPEECGVDDVEGYITALLASLRIADAVESLSLDDRFSLAFGMPPDMHILHYRHANLSISMCRTLEGRWKSMRVYLACDVKRHEMLVNCGMRLLFSFPGRTAGVALVGSSLLPGTCVFGLEERV
jgi:hypothetical protein